MNNIDKQYQELLEDILANGVEKENRTGVNTISVFGRTIRHKMNEGFPLLTTKKMAWKQIVTELLWFLRGESNIQSLVKNGNYIWVGDAYKRYADSHETPGNPNGKTLGEQLMSVKPMEHSRESFINEIKINDKFAKKWGELGKIYGVQWRNWNGIDQIQSLINQLRNNPDSRRLMVSAWNVSDLDDMVLPPCHYGFQLYTKKLTIGERIDYYNKSIAPFNRSSDYLDWQLDDLGVPKRKVSLMWQQRSVDTPLGLPFNIASYALLLVILANEVGMIPDEIIGNFGDTHIYTNQIDGIKEQLSREPLKLPKVEIKYRMGVYDRDLKNLKFDQFELINYKSHDKIYLPLSN